MCLLQTNKTADDAFRRMGSADQRRWEKKLFRFAAMDNKECAEGLAIHAHLVDDWATDPVLRSVRKVECGRHRCYVVGKNTDCKYFLCYILANKRDADDKPGTDRFKKMILNGLSDSDITRTLLPPPVEENEDD